MAEYMEFNSGGVFKATQGKCKCGEVHDFKAMELLPDKNNIDTLNFKKPFLCPKCEKEYIGIKTNISSEYKTKKVRRYSPLGLSFVSILCLALLFGGYEIYHGIRKNMPDESIPTSVKDMTNKQYNQFIKYKDDQKQKQYDNSKIGTNN